MKEQTLWLRDEARTTERRAPLLPEGAKELTRAGIDVIVEKSGKRIFADALYEEAGCTLAEAGSWTSAPRDAVILGLKELPETPASLVHTHIYFAHAFKAQCGWKQLLTRFERGGGSLLDIEYMTDLHGRRVVAFGYWAGYMGAALALLHWLDKAAGRSTGINGGLTPFESADALDTLIDERKSEQCNSGNGKSGGRQPKALVIGAGGRSGTGASEILERHGVSVTRWGRTETASIDRAAILDHDILVNCAFVADLIPPFLAPHHLAGEHRLSVISDVSCDPFSDFNPLPLYDAPTSWNTPAVPVGNKAAHVDLIAIDNLPSLLPVEASMEFAAMLLPYLKNLPNRSTDPVWRSCDAAYRQAVAAMAERKAS
jgi:saccharopine dehydrogenase (NAD+, L-lysine-forming)